MGLMKAHSPWCQKLLQAEIVGNWECMKEEVSYMLILSISDLRSQFFLCKGTFLKHHMLVFINYVKNSIKIIGFRHTKCLVRVLYSYFPLRKPHTVVIRISV